MKPKYFLALFFLCLFASATVTGQAKEPPDYKKCSMAKSDDFSQFRAFVYQYYLRGIRQNLGMADEMATTAKVFGHALSRELNQFKRGTTQQHRWNQIEGEMGDYLLCYATVFLDEHGVADPTRRATYLARIKKVYQEALLGAYDAEISAAIGTSAPSFFGANEAPANKAISLSAEETELLGHWNNDSMKFGNTNIELLPAENFLLLQADRTYQYHAHTKGANVVHTKGTWRYYRNGSKRYLALQHTHVKKSGTFEALPKRRESIFVLQEVSKQRLMLFEDKDDPALSVTLVYSKFGNTEREGDVP
jgi:hypothetical protein